MNYSDKELELLDPKKFIIIKNARVNNLKGVSVAIPRNKLVVITGLSGSGKSSLAFDTLFAEGQRMYVESLSSYARQFLGRMQKPEVDYIRGISPAIAIEQKVTSKNPRSTVGTSTEIYDYLKLLFARIGVTYSPISGNIVKKDNITDVISWVMSQKEGDKILILSTLIEIRTITEDVNVLQHKGFTRVVYQNEIIEIEDFLTNQVNDPKIKHGDIFVLIDRLVVKKEDEDTQFRLSDSVQTALYEGDGQCTIQIMGGEKRSFSNKFESDGMVFEEPSVNMFAFNNAYSACRTCEGLGHVLGLDKDKVFPNKELSVYEGLVAPWKGDKMGEWQEPLVKNSLKFNFPIHRPYNELDDKQKELLWTGNKYFNGLNDFFKYLEENTYKIQYRVMLSRYRGRTVCPDCNGTRLRKDAQYVKIDSKSIADIVLLSLNDCHQFFLNLQLPEYEQKVAQRILKEIQNRLGYICQVGLGYLTLNRLMSTLSGGESQRIKLATSLGSALVGSMYILDEPSIGLHPRDTRQLIEVLKSLRDMGNTVIVVEHEEEVMLAADQLIDIGPDAGAHGGKLIFQLTQAELADKSIDIDSHTLRHLQGKVQVVVPNQRRPWSDFVQLSGVNENNLKNIDVKFPLGVLTVITGVSGSGKSTLVKKVLVPALSKIIGGVSDDLSGKFDKIKVSRLKGVHKIEFVDQNPIGKSSRSNPITYTKAYDIVRSLYADQPLSKQRGYKPTHFSFNVDGGRCETCLGEGEQVVEMQFMADIHLLCESCAGKRFKQEVLEVKYKDKNIADILDLTVDEAVAFFVEKQKLIDKILPLQQVGLGYIKLGQSSSSLSGGEAQRVKLASFLIKGESTENTVFVFDEPTTGLHFHDINKLLNSINALVSLGNTAIIIEHNMEVIKSADWIIDLGPEGGENGGYICFEGTPEDMVKVENNFTAEFLKGKLVKS